MSVHTLTTKKAAQSTAGAACVIYVLVSDVPPGRSGPFVTARIDAGRRYAADHGWDVRKVFADIGTTAGDWRRPQFRELQAYCRDHADVRYVLVRSDADFAKSPAVQAKFRRFLAERDIEATVIGATRKDSQ